MNRKKDIRHLVSIFFRTLMLRAGVGGVILFLLVILSCVIVLLQPDPGITLYEEPLLAPSFKHWLGTDQLGRDVLGMIMAGLCMSAFVSCASVVFGVLLGVCLGSLAAMNQNVFGEILSRMGDFIFAFPVLVLAVLFRQALGYGIWPIILAIGLFNTAVFMRVTYGSSRPLWMREYVLAAFASGKSRYLIALQHILPNIMNVLIVQITVQLSMNILAEAALSWLGVGIQPPTPSLGRMLMESTTYYWLAPQLVIAPASVIILIVLSLNNAGDRLRDHLDPKQNRGNWGI